MPILITALLVTLGVILQADIPATTEGEADYYATAMVWLFVALLISILK